MAPNDKVLIRESVDNMSSQSLSKLLSVLMEESNGYVDPKALGVAACYATEIAEASNATKEEKDWLRDFNKNIGVALAKQHKMDIMIEQRAKTDKVPPALSDQGAASPSFATGHGPDHGSDNYEQISFPNVRVPEIKLNQLVIKPEKFNGNKKEARRWLEDFEAAASANSWSDQVMVRYMSAFLVGPAKDWFSTLVQPVINRTTQWQTLKNIFVDFYVGPDVLQSLREELEKVRQRFGEPASDFIPRIMRILRQIDALTSSCMDDAELAKIIRRKLLYSYQEKCIGIQFTGISHLNHVCQEIESRSGMESRTTVKKNSESDNGVVQKKNTRLNRSRNGNSTKNENGSSSCSRCDRNGHTSDSCWAQTKLDGSRLIKPVNKPGNSDSVSKTAAITAENENNNEDSDSDELSQIQVKTTRFSRMIVAATGSNALLLPIRINQKKIIAMIDTGSDCTIMHKNLANLLNLKIKPRKYNLLGAGNVAIACEGYAKAVISIKLGKVKKEAEVDVVVASVLCTDFVLGNDVMAPFKISVSVAKRVVSFENERNGARALESYDLAPRSETIVKACVDKVSEGTAIVVHPFKFPSKFLVANSVSIVRSGRVDVLVANVNETAEILEVGTQLGSVEPYISDTSETVGENIRCAYARKIATSGETIEISDELDDDKVSDLMRLVQTKIDAFSLNNQLGSTSMIEHSIELESGAKPFSEPLRRRPIVHKEETSRQIKEMLAQGIIEPSNSPWASAYVMVKKKTGELRLCIDFRRLNSVTKKCSYPLPNVTDCLEPLAGNVYFSQLDLASGFWQIPIETSAKECTAFRTEEGHWQYRRMPFGLCNAPASFQRLMNAVFSGLRGAHFQVFIDDLCIATKTWKEHLELLTLVFDLLIKSNLKLKASKCQFGKSNVIFLGHRLSRDGISADPSKLSAISKLPKPANKDELRRILGLLGYYRRLVPKFAAISAPLTKLLRLKSAFVWEAEQAEAFDQLKAALTSNPVLACFNHNDPIALKTDASYSGIAGLLLQRQDNEWKIVTCASRRLNCHEVHNTPTELECLAIVYSFDKFRNYLIGKHVTILTDHCALCALKLKKPSNAKLARWAASFAEFDFSIQYVKGSNHQDVDCLSRAPVDVATDPYLEGKVFSTYVSRAFKPTIDKEAYALMIVPVDAKTWKSADNDEEAIGLFTKARNRQKGFKIFNGLLYLNERLYVPRTLRAKIISENHDNSPADHGGVKATLARLEGYFWPNMAEDVATFVRSCKICQKTKAVRQKPYGEMRSFEAFEPLDTVCFDAMGPLPVSIGNKRHIIIGIDVFTRFAEAEACEDVRAETFAAFFRRYIGRFGIPRRVISDNAPTFSNRVVKDLAERLHVTWRFSTPHHHEGNSPAERIIQSLKTKLIAHCNEPANSLDWELSLPECILSLNTSLNSSTGFTPFELVFGRRHWTPSELVDENRSPTNTYAELREMRALEWQKQAIAKQFDMKQKSKFHFDMRFQPHEFSEGDLVLARTMGRKGKLENTFQGPYVVIRCSNDIYTVESVEGRKERLQRHVRDLRPYFIRQPTLNENSVEAHFDDSSSPASQNTPQFHSRSDEASTTTTTSQANQHTSSTSNNSKSMQANYLLWLLLMPSMVVTYEFQKASPAQWVESKAYASPAPTLFRFQIRYGSPCPIIQELNRIPEHLLSRASQRCESVFLSQIQDRLKRLVVHPVNHLPIIHNKTVEHHQETKSQQQEVQEVAQRYQEAALSSIVQQTQTNKVTSHVVDPSGHTNKRQLAALAFCLGAYVSNVWTTKTERSWDREAMKDMDQQLKLADHSIANLTHATNITFLRLRAIEEQISLQTQLVEHQVDQIEHLMTDLPELNVLISDGISRMHLIGSLLDRTRVSFRKGNPDLDALSMLLDSEILDEVDKQSVQRRSVQFIVPDSKTLIVQFVANRRAPDTEIYAVSAFSFWSDLLTTPALYEYDGPSHVVYNSSNQCIAGIRPAPFDGNRALQVSCQKTSKIDKRLSHWTKHPTARLDEAALETQVIQSFPYVFVYCFGQKIEIGKQQLDCPPYAFKLALNESWSTPSYNYNPDVVNLINTVDLPHLIDLAHFPNNSHYVDDTKALHVIWNLTQISQNLAKEGQLVTVGKFAITYKHGFNSLSLVVVGMLLTFIIKDYIRFRAATQAHVSRRRSEARSHYASVRTSHL